MTRTAADGPPRSWRFIKRHPWAIGYVLVMTAIGGAWFPGGDLGWPDAVFTALLWVGAPVIYPVYFTSLFLSVFALITAPSALLWWLLILLFAVSEAVVGAWVWAVAHRPIQPTPHQAAALRRRQSSVRAWPTAWDDDHTPPC